MSCLNLNKVVLAGRLTADLELKQTQSGISVTSFSIAINRKYSKEQEQKKVDFIDCVAWRQTAEFITRYFRKGSAICVIGAIEKNPWTDQQGKKRYETVINVEEAMFVDSKSDNQPAENGSFIPGTTGYVPDAYAPTAAPKFEEINPDDDLPF
ncbi:MAG: single-stranded DNA-binding protein [Clostridia bacterium]|nr:single-stranded DNA-binding protein [Clostridia bacterium]